jgi:amidase
VTAADRSHGGDPRPAGEAVGVPTPCDLASLDRATDIIEMDARQLSAAIHARTVSCVEVMTAYLDRIDRLNPEVTAIVSLEPRDALLHQARERDDALGRGESLGWMHGMPQAVKDLLPTRGIRTTLGSPMFASFVPETDAITVERLRRAGAILVGKTNVPELGLGSHTYNQVFGTTRNAYDRTRTAGGSSGGAAVALALRMLPVADGSDYAGSLRNPAAYNNVLGFRPTFGCVPTQELDAFLPTLSVVGPMARTVTDLALLLSVLAGYDPRAPLSSRESPARFALDTAQLDRDVTGTRVGWLGDLGLPFEPGVLDLARSAVTTLASLGCIVEDVALDFPLERVWQSFVTIRAYQIGAILKDLYADPARRAMMKPEARWEVERGAGLTAFQLAEASVERTAWYHAVCRLFERFDYLVLPSAQLFPFDATLPWPREIAGVAMDTYHRWMQVVVPVTMSGCPALNVPCGFGPAGLPMGVQLIGRHHDELGCLQLARAYERATGWVERRRPPMIG